MDNKENDMKIHVATIGNNFVNLFFPLNSSSSVFPSNIYQITFGNAIFPENTLFKLQAFNIFLVTVF